MRNDAEWFHGLRGLLLAAVSTRSVCMHASNRLCTTMDLLRNQSVVALDVEQHLLRLKIDAANQWSRVKIPNKMYTSIHGN